MLALTIWQPWASLIMAGAKPFEFRGWRAPRGMIGQRIVIHAAKRKPDLHEIADLIRVLEHGGQDAAETCMIADKALPILRRPPASLPLAAGLGTAVLGEPVIGTRVAEQFGVHAADRGDDALAGELAGAAAYGSASLA